MSLVTFLCPSRGRPESLRKSIESLRRTAYDPTCFDVLVYLDDDDPTLDEYLAGSKESLVLGDADVRVFRPRNEARVGLVVGDPLGYARLNECIADRLIPAARGQWLWLWNDDAIMDTEGWDIQIRKHPINCVLNPDTNHQSHATGLNVFPAVPKAWVDLVGWARNGANDTWWQYIGQMLRAQVNISVYVTHDRSDLTGGHDDATRAGNNYDSSTFYTAETQAAMRADAERIAEVFGR